MSSLSAQLEIFERKKRNKRPVSDTMSEAEYRKHLAKLLVGDKNLSEDDWSKIIVSEHDLLQLFKNGTGGEDDAEEKDKDTFMVEMKESLKHAGFQNAQIVAISEYKWKEELAKRLVKKPLTEWPQDLLQEFITNSTYFRKNRKADNEPLSIAQMLLGIGDYVPVPDESPLPKSKESTGASASEASASGILDPSTEKDAAKLGKDAAKLKSLLERMCGA